MEFERYGLTWYTTEAEMIPIIQPGEEIRFDKGLNAYCIEPKKKINMGFLTVKLKVLLLYLTRWQLSGPILAIVLLKLNNFHIFYQVIFANLIGGLIFFYIDKKIFQTK